MNPDSAASNSSRPHPNQRKERGAIAVQACYTCRTRKQRCDEARPRCRLCSRMNLDCKYPEPQPVKKDNTLMGILDLLKSLEGKVNRITTHSPPPTRFGPAQPSVVSQPSFSPCIDPGSYIASSIQVSLQASPSGNPARSQPYRHASAAHKMLTWPAIQQVLLQALPTNISDLRSLEAEGSAFIIRMQKGTPNLPSDESLVARPFVSMQMQATRTSGGPRVTFPDLNEDLMQRLANAYFDTFNFIYPFMDRHTFLSDTLTKVSTEGFNSDTKSVIALLVFALGELAIDGSRGNPIDVFKGRQSGLRGGSVDRPPGLAIFNEARKHLGFVLTECELENVQIFSLAALYYESCSRHVDFWRLTVSASLACQVLVTCNQIDWTTQRGNLIKRAFWHCAIMETGLHLELDLPLTGIIRLEGRVGLPSFSGSYCEADHNGNLSSHFEAHYASQIALRRLCADLHNNINDSMRPMNTLSASNKEFCGPTAATLKQLAAQLDQWRSSLSQPLQWSDDDHTAFPSYTQALRSYQPSDPSFNAQERPEAPLFTADLDREPVHYPYAYDILVALLRTRYYYAKYMVHRPFVYKALHFPEHITTEDAEGVAECLKACIKWPLTLSPASRRKRLIPYLFCWSQNFLGILLIFHLTNHSPILQQIRQQLCGPQFKVDAEVSVDLMLDWIRDLKSSDPIAAWCYNILQSIYHMDS